VEVEVAAEADTVADMEVDRAAGKRFGSHSA
jgi:hypothetical protein